MNIMRFDGTDIYDKAEKAGRIDGLNLSEVVFEGLKLFLARRFKDDKNGGSSNPQLSLLDSVKPRANRIAEISYVKRQLERYMRLVDRSNQDGARLFLEKAWKYLLRLERLCDVVNEKELDEYYREKSKILIGWNAY